MGADQAVHLLDAAFEGLDCLGVATALSKAIGTLEYDLILCGRQAVDDDMAQVGPAIAVLLGIPFVTVVTDLKISEDRQKAEVTRQIEGGSEIIEAPLPLLITCQKGLNEPRLPSLKGIMAAKKKEITILDAAAIGFDANVWVPLPTGSGKPPGIASGPQKRNHSGRHSGRNLFPIGSSTTR